jgi:hypothetical protein
MGDVSPMSGDLGAGHIQGAMIQVVGGARAWARSQPPNFVLIDRLITQQS